MEQEKINKIMNFSGYFSKYPIEEGVHGPEMVGDNVFISVFHFLEFKGLNPFNYDTYKMGSQFGRMTSHSTRCKYQTQSFWINKYDFEFMEDNMDVVEEYKK